MKRLWIAAALLLAILGGCLCNAWYLGSLTREMNQLLEQAGQLARGAAAYQSGLPALAGLSRLSPYDPPPRGY